MQILLPMAGAGKRFIECGYEKPKPLVSVLGKPMVERVVENLGLENDYVFLVQKDHLQHFYGEFIDVFNRVNSYKLIEVDALTEGAACTALLGKKHINQNIPLMIANTDQIMEYNRAEFYDTFYKSPSDGMIFTFKSLEKKHSYVKLDELDRYVREVAEKVVISNNATVGVYLWRKASNFFDAAEKMIKDNIRTNNEFYICPVYNVNISWMQKIEVYPIRKHHPIGTPEDLQKYLRLKGF